MTAYPTYDCRHKNGISRRHFLGGSLGGFFGFALAQQGAGLLAAAANGSTAKKCLVLWMDGGPSQLETFDPKPGQTNGGDLGAIDTCVKGVRIGESLPEMAKQMNKLSVLRNLSSTEGEHDRARYFLHTGYKPIEGFPRPSLGSMASYSIGTANSEPSLLPSYVTIGGDGFGPAYLGTEHGPFTIDDPSTALKLLRSVASRKKQLTLAGKLSAAFDASPPEKAVETRRAMLKRIEALTESGFASALDVELESATVRKRYGDSDFAERCLVARRMLEAGVSFVEVVQGGWDTHVNNSDNVGRLCSQIDRPWSALMQDLSATGLLDETVVVWMGEFGRTPVINAQNGRDHFPQITPVVIGGGGVAGGQMVGETSPGGTAIKGEQHRVPDLFATILASMGVDPATELPTDFGSMTKASDGGEVISGLL